MSRYFLITTFLLVGTIWTSCTKFPPDGEKSLPDYSVICILNNSTAPNRLMLDRVVEMNKNIQPVTGANVVIQWPGNYVILKEDSRRMGQYEDVSGKLRIKPRTRYELRISLSNQVIITGETTTPGIPRILQPQWGDTVVATIKNDDSLNYYCTIMWQRAEMAAGYLPIIFHRPLQINPGDWFEPPPSSYINFHQNYFDVPIWHNLPQNQDIRLYVAAIDSNFFRHVFKGINRVGLNNALGVFGSAMIDSVLFYYRAPD